jgi:hypothetical protein
MDLQGLSPQGVDESGVQNGAVPARQTVRAAVAQGVQHLPGGRPPVAAPAVVGEPAGPILGETGLQGENQLRAEGEQSQPCRVNPGGRQGRRQGADDLLTALQLDEQALFGGQRGEQLA